MVEVVSPMDRAVRPSLGPGPEASIARNGCSVTLRPGTMALCQLETSPYVL